MRITMLPDWECAQITMDDIVTALGGEEKLRKETLRETCAYFGYTYVI